MSVNHIEKTKMTIHHKIDRCILFGKVDNILLIISVLVTSTIALLAYDNQLLILMPLLVLCWLTHIIVMFHCRRVWALRVYQWVALLRWCSVIESVCKLSAKNARQVYPAG